MSQFRPNFHISGALVPIPFTDPDQIWQETVDRRSTSLIVLSHWPHVATQVEQQVVELVAELVFAMYFNGTIHIATS